MKKVIVFIVAVAMVTVSNAQVRIGAKAGINLSNIVGKDVEGFRTKTGINIGALANLSLTNALSVQGEVYYSMQGARWDDDNEKTTLNYLQVPLLARFTSNKGFFAEAGPQVGFLLKAEDDNEGDVYDIKEFLKKTDLSLVIGGGYNINPNISVNARYNFGMIKLYDEEKNGVFQVGISYMFGSAR